MGVLAIAAGERGLHGDIADRTWDFGSPSPMQLLTSSHASIILWARMEQ
jgi:hypothetical protein